MRGYVVVSLFVFGCTPKPQGPQARRECAERYADYENTTPLTCVAPVPFAIAPVVVGPATIRGVFPFPVPGVPRRSYSSDAFFVLDVRPDGQHFVGTGTCPTHGDPALAAIDAAGAFHVICAAEKPLDDSFALGPSHYHTTLDDLRLVGSSFERAGPSLEIEDAKLRAIGFPDGTEPILLYQRIEQGPKHAYPGPFVERRWLDGAPSITVEIVSGVTIDPILIVDSTRVAVVTQYQVAEIHGDTCVVSQLPTESKADPDGCFESTWITQDAKEVVLHQSAVDEFTGHPTMSVGNVAGRTARGPTLIGDERSVCDALGAMKVTAASDLRVSCDASECVAMSADFIAGDRIYRTSIPRR